MYSKDDHFCFCSDTFFSEILERQRQNILIFDKLIETHAGCKFGCGSCIDLLKEYMEENDLYLTTTEEPQLCLLN